MANNFTIWDYGQQAPKNFKSTDTGTLHTAHHNVDVIAPGETHIGEVGGNTIVFMWTPSIFTSALNPGDVVADTESLTSIFRKTNGTGIIQSVVVSDKALQSAALDIYFLDVASTFGTEGDPTTMNDANIQNILGWVSVVPGDYKNLGGNNSVAQVRNVGIPVKAISATSNLAAAILIPSGTPTYPASSLVIRIGMLRD